MFAEFQNISALIEQLNPFVFQRIKSEIQNFEAEFKLRNVDVTESKDLLRLFQKKKEGYSQDYVLSEELTNLIDKEVVKLIHRFESKFNYFDKMFNFVANVEHHNVDIKLERLWINFQQAGEFLPLHNHTGVYSFVIWVKAPFDIQDEIDSITNPDLIKNRSAHFEFVYTDTLGKISTYNIPVDKKWEGRICVFPAELYHQVYPFYTTDDARISLAGNYRLEITPK
jgi:hypothetical protein